MRKLLVASQKGGVGKTTTSINLAAATAMAGARVLLLDADPLSSISTSLNLAKHPQRQPLRQAGIDLPGVLVSNVIPGLDVLSPYEDGGCSDEELDQLLSLLATSSFQECYGSLIVDTPPFMGANPGQLLATCEEFILVMRAEPMAYRTLPAFLELVQRARPHGVKMRGILLTLPDGEVPGGRWERELRGRFGNRILPPVIPHDETVSQALLFNQIVSHAQREAPASLAYHALVENLDLASDARETIERTSAASALLLASASLKTARTARRPVERPAPRTPPRPVVSPVAPPEPAPAETLAAVDMTAPEVVADILPEAVRRRLTPAAPLPVASAPPLVPENSPAPPPTPVPPSGFPMWMGGLWVAVAIVLGVTLRFLNLPPQVMPYLVGTGVAAVVIILVRVSMTQEDARTKEPPSASTARQDASTRLSSVKRRIPAPAGEVNGN